MRSVTVDFKNVVSELENKELSIGLINNNIHSICLEDTKGNVYMIETYWNGSYLDGLINKGIAVEFNRLENPLYNGWVKKWNVSEFRDYLVQQQQFWN